MAHDSEQQGAGDWGEYRRLILQELQRLHEGQASTRAELLARLDEVKDRINTLQTMELAEMKAAIAVLKFKSGLWGFTAGAVPGALAILYTLLKT